MSEPISQENPYSAPQASLHQEKFSKSEVWQVLGTGLVIGASLGAGTNAINGWVGPTYFTYVLRWTENIWMNAVIQGVMEAGLYGLLNAAIFVMIANFLGRGIRSVSHVRKYLLSCAAAVLVVWILGGLIGVFIAPHAARDPLYKGPFPVVAFDDPGFCWTLGSLNLAIWASWPITFIGGYLYSRKS